MHNANLSSYPFQSKKLSQYVSFVRLNILQFFVEGGGERERGGGGGGGKVRMEMQREQQLTLNVFSSSVSSFFTFLTPFASFLVSCLRFILENRRKKKIRKVSDIQNTKPLNTFYNKDRCIPSKGV